MKIFPHCKYFVRNHVLSSSFATSKFRFYIKNPYVLVGKSYFLKNSTVLM